MYTPKQVQAYRNRINRANASFSVCGDMLLSFEIDGMSQEQRLFLQQALKNSRRPMEYAYLNTVITKAAV